VIGAGFGRDLLSWNTTHSVHGIGSAAQQTRRKRDPAALFVVPKPLHRPGPKHPSRSPHAPPFRYARRASRSDQRRSRHRVAQRTGTGDRAADFWLRFTGRAGLAAVQRRLLDLAKRFTPPRRCVICHAVATIQSRAAGLREALRAARMRDGALHVDTYVARAKRRVHAGRWCVCGLPENSPRSAAMRIV